MVRMIEDRKSKQILETKAEERKKQNGEKYVGRITERKGKISNI